jgi:dTDP-4-amino-4,6-dideoxygalactose transaminase
MKHISEGKMIEYENLLNSNNHFLNEIESAVNRVIRGGWYVLGNEVSAFETEFSQYIGSKNCIGVANGLDALTLSIKALDLPMRSDVLVASNTYIATILAIVEAGHNPILVEPDVETFNIDPKNLVKSITVNTKAICVTHLFGKLCQMDEICDFANQYGLTLIEDCAQSHGAKFDGKMSGTFGNAGCYSFYPTKNLGAFGDAGAIVTDDDELAEKLRHIRNYGSKIKYVNRYVGVNSRLDEIQAAILRVKLKYLDDMTNKKRELASVYFSELPNWLCKPQQNERNFDVFHIFGIRCDRRDELRKYLLNNNIKTEIHYPIPPHKQEAMKEILKGDYPIANILHSTELSLPISVGHEVEDIINVCEVISNFN